MGEGRRGTRVARRPALTVSPISSPRAVIPAGIRDLASGNPDPSLLPDLRPYLRELSRARPGEIGRLYGEPAHLPALVDVARAQFVADGVPAGALAVVGGALDGVERALQAHLRPGDHVIVEDPGYPGVLDLVSALALVAVPVLVDGEGLRPDAFERALATGAQAAVLTPRAQNPTGAALTEARARRLRAVLRLYPEVLAIEDDHAGVISGTEAVTLAHRQRARWAVVRSVSKALGPDLRLAVVSGDDATIARIEGRRQLGAGWVSEILQRVVVALWSDASVASLMARATSTYAARRQALVDALAQLGVTSYGRSGFNVWIPVPEEQAVVGRLLAEGWAITAGERFRRRSGPAVRISVARLLPAEAPAVAALVAAAVRPGPVTRLG
ncbi:MAG TPA: aminotransferase class I/II-fold pyridoxal phosphate-dependent enzyme [Acidimicrobiales bacterium]|nr:aminotransferase class I/II-fold pyridoxal phosphate-dependent enzyme [Acidimicrobiales bacterium]